METNLLILVVINSIFIFGFFIFALMGKHKIRHSDLDGRVKTNSFFAMLQNYWFTITEPCVTFFIKVKITPNMISYFGLFLGLLAGLFFGLKEWGLGGWTLIASGVFDLFDGRVARATKTVSKKGAFLDSCLDRYGDSAILSGLAIAFLNNWLLYPVLLCFMGFSCISYNKARSEASGIKCDVGGFQRPVRVLALSLACIATPILSFFMNEQTLVLFYFIIPLLALGTVHASIYRLYYSYNKIKEHYKE